MQFARNASYCFRKTVQFASVKNKSSRDVVVEDSDDGSSDDDCEDDDGCPPLAVY